MITYDSNAKVFHLQTNETSYLILLYQDQIPMHVYWGKRMRSSEAAWYVQAPYRRSSIVANRHPDDPKFSAEYYPFEYPSYGGTDYRAPAYEVRDQNGYTLCDPRFESYRIFEGKPDLEGLPSLHDTKNETQTLELVLFDQVLGLRIRLYYTVFEQHDVITRHTVFENAGEQTLQLQEALSASMDFKHAPDRMLQLTGTALRERHLIERSLTQGTVTVDSTRGISSHQASPFIALAEADTTEQTGRAYGLNLCYSGNFLASVSCDMYQSARVQIGIHPFHFSWKLQPGASFTTPEAHLVFSANGLNGMSQRYHAVYRDCLYTGEHQYAPRPVVLNTWEAAYFDFTHDSVVDFAKQAADLGIEMLVLDDGWFGHRNDASSSLGDWTVNPEKLPYGLKGLADEVHALGMKFGLWVEPEMISPDSDLYRAHPDWCFHVPSRIRHEWRNQLVLDLSRDEVCDAILQQISDVLASAPIDYVKWDHNRRLSECGSEAWPADQQGELFHRYTLNVYRMMDTLTKRFPHILFENCASGGARCDVGAMHYFPQTWISDNSDGIGRLKIQYGSSFVFPPVMMTSHVSASPNHQVARETPLNLRKHTSFLFNLGYELNPCLLSEEEKEAVRKQIAEYKEERSLIQQGTFYRLLSPFKGNETAWMTVSADQSRALVCYFKVLVEAEEAYLGLRLQGLDPKADYRCVETGCVYGGDQLMELGLPVDWENGDFFSELWTLEKI